MRLLVSAAALLALAAPAAAAQQPATTPSAAAGADLSPPEAPIDDAAAADAADTLGDLPPVPRDRFEGFNRAMWGFNQGVDRVLLKPVALGYRFVTPRPARRGLSRIFANLNEPWSFINNLLQGKPRRALNNLGRFVVNTTIGVGGLADHASDLGLRPAPEDFGQTLAAWGVKSSAYLVLPLFGPSTVRDGIGTGVASFADPYNVCLSRCTNLRWREQIAIQAVELTSIRSDLIESGADAFLASSLDSYAAARSAYLQGRAAAIADEDGGSGTAGETPATLDPTIADAPPETPSPASPPTTTDPAADPAVSTDPKLSFNLDLPEGRP